MAVIFVTPADPPTHSELRAAAESFQKSAQDILYILPIGCEYTSHNKILSSFGRYVLNSIAVCHVFTDNTTVKFAPVELHHFTTSCAISSLCASRDIKDVKIVYSPKLLKNLETTSSTWTATRADVHKLLRAADHTSSLPYAIDESSDLTAATFPAGIDVSETLALLRPDLPTPVYTAIQRYHLYDANIELGWSSTCRLLADVERKPQATSRPKRHIAVVGGSFDPITNAHLDIAYTTLNHAHTPASTLDADAAGVDRRLVDCPVDEVWIVPCGHRDDKRLNASPLHRFVMSVLAVEQYFPTEMRVKVSAVEVFEEAAYASYKLLTALNETFQHAHFSLVVGADLVRSLPRWKFAEDLLRTCSFLVHKRAGYDIVAHPDLMYRLTNNEASPVPPSDISSTLARQLLASEKHKDCIVLRTILPGQIITYIENCLLYVFVPPTHRITHTAATLEG